MNMPWNGGREGRNDQLGSNDNLSLIPWWSIVLAIAAFAAMQYLRVLMGYSWGTLAASYVLLAGYVSRDVKRRNMPAALWMLIVVVMPGGIGAVVYFLLRQPILSRCPHCSTEISSSFHFCPQCQFQLAPVCGQCFRGVEITDVYCKQCGHDLAEDNVPSRLRAFRD
jgi:hypothetical protein